MTSDRCPMFAHVYMFKCFKSVLGCPLKFDGFCLDFVYHILHGLATLQKYKIPLISNNNQFLKQEHLRGCQCFSDMIYRVLHADNNATATVNKDMDRADAAVITILLSFFLQKTDYLKKNLHLQSNGYFLTQMSYFQNIINWYT